MVEIETAERIHRSIEKKISSGATYIDALVEYAYERNIEIETVAEIVKKSTIIKEKIRDEANGKRLLKVKNDNNTSKFFE